MSRRRAASTTAFFVVRPLRRIALRTRRRRYRWLSAWAFDPKCDSFAYIGDDTATHELSSRAERGVCIFLRTTDPSLVLGFACGRLGMTTLFRIVRASCNC